MLTVWILVALIVVGIGVAVASSLSDIGRHLRTIAGQQWEMLDEMKKIKQLMGGGGK